MKEKEEGEEMPKKRTRGRGTRSGTREERKKRKKKIGALHERNSSTCRGER